MSDTARYGLIVCDASPLITLAKAGELDVLLRQPLPIIIPDAVYREAAKPSYDDGVVLMEWVENNTGRVRVAATQAGLQQDILLKGGVKAPDLGETAAIEVTDRFLASSPDSRVVLVYEDAGVRKRERDARVDIMSTGQLLRAMEASGLIQSSDQILDRAAGAGRNVTEQQAVIEGDDAPPGLVEQFRSGRMGGGSISTGLLDATPRSLKPPGSGTPDADPAPLDRPRGRSR